MSEENTIHKFTSITEICKDLNITRPTYYRRVEALGWDKDKREFTEEEYKELHKTLYVNNGKNSKNAKNDTKNTEITTSIIANYQKQISELHNLMDQQQRLSLDLQNKLNDKEKKLEQLESVNQKYLSLEKQAEIDSEKIEELTSQLSEKDNDLHDTIQKLQKEKSKGLWSRLFGGK
ncbi:MAG: hypothetical protein LKK24_07760 [Leuconostoc mesenteroides]|jgi:chromosome segregation ATPase|uniref:hypothetical protein n=1 Tax=Leuconostoc TaxID=1243 RepID=UPI0021A8B066|nr:hypothetical protein [Leuconostoc mesenteroides]MCI2120962.1 hypothetical protein [Leuconostoc mesenteroides]MCT3053799.1 hypothetical protein [Leuconostoc mesenteroides]